MTVEQQNQLNYLLNEARKATMSDAEMIEQRMSFAYGNSAFENPMITKEMVENEARKLAAK
ncbi:MAG: hypothetical protein ACU0BP_05285 [Sulfitobacter sp.]|uniref:hypothetical protein n=1 Tax=Sulfitobacter sp. OXR-159 TaxID=3100174 RepID=UPI002AC92768|nr:hypothetical protein [Sulfitobacter sp. OXR-159]WPZ28932.1 hypothetical protein T8A63_15035 [Sulfitobacter sp. OXR-159]